MISESESESEWALFLNDHVKTGVMTAQNSALQAQE